MVGFGDYLPIEAGLIPIPAYSDPLVESKAAKATKQGTQAQFCNIAITNCLHLCAENDAHSTFQVALLARRGFLPFATRLFS